MDVFDSHLFLDGGKACVPPEMTGAFNNIYTAALTQGEVMFVVEKKPPVFKLVFDLDMRVAAPLKPEQVLDFSKAVHSAVQEFYGKPTCHMIVCTCEDRRGRGAQWKVGAHLVWPSIATVCPDALRCRDHVLASEAVQKFAPLFQNEMENVVDRSVLDKNGVRMIGSYKVVPCRCQCMPCDRCRGRGKLVEHGVYWPRYVVREDAVETIQTPSTLEAVRYWVHETSLRNCTMTLSKAFKCVENAAYSDGEDEEGLLQRSVKGRLQRHPLEPVLPALEGFLATLPGPYLTAKFTSLHKGGSNDDPVFFARTTSRFCLNIGKNHNSNNVYFLFSKRGAYQMCFCRCQTIEGRKYGMCQDFHSAPFEMSRDLKVALFGAQVLVEADKSIQPAKTQDAAISSHYERLLRHVTGPPAQLPKKRYKKKK
jgi:hypothetical protein